jgi:hypothetical protein
MDDDTLLPFSLPAVCRKKMTAAFDGGRLTSDGGVLLLSSVDKQLGLCAALSRAIPDHREEWRVTHRLEDILRARILAIACGYADADDLDRCAAIRHSSWPAGGCRRAATIFARSRPSHGGRTRQTSAPCYPACGHRPGQDGDPHVPVLIKLTASERHF